MQARLDSFVAEMRKDGIHYREAVSEFKKAFVRVVLRENAGNVTRAASALGLHRNTLSRICFELDVDVRSFRPARRRPPASATGALIVKRSAR